MDHGRERLHEAMNDQRLKLRRRWVEVARRAGMSVTNLNLIRKGQINITDIAAANLEDALEWPQGRIQEILDSARPEEHLDPLTGPTAEIGQMVEAYRKRYGPDAAAELLQKLIQANIQAAGEIDQNPVTRTDS